MIPKRQWMRRHARKRAYERWGINLHQSLERFIVKAIQSGNPERAQHLAARSLNRSVWLVLVNRIWIPVVYDRRGDCLATVLSSPSRQERPAHRAEGANPHAEAFP